MNSGMYTEREVQCLKEGIGAVRSVLSGTDTEAKRHLLFYLDWYMDPYYKQDISGIKKDLKEMLKKLLCLPMKRISLMKPCISWKDIRIRHIRYWRRTGGT